MDRRDPGGRHRSGALVARGPARHRIPDDGDLDDDDFPPRVLPRRPTSGQRARARPRRSDRPRRLRRRREDHGRRHLEADAHLHRCRRGERRGVAPPPGRPRRPLPQGAGGRVPRRVARDVLQVLRGEPRRDRPSAGDPRGLPVDLLDEPPAALAVLAARQGGSRLSVPSAWISTRSSTSSRWRGPTRAV